MILTLSFCKKVDDPLNLVVPALQGGDLYDMGGKQDSVHVRISRFELKFEFQSHSSLVILFPS